MGEWKSMMRINIKALRDNFQMPRQAHSSDAGYDVFAIDDGKFINEGGTEFIQYDLGFAAQPVISDDHSNTDRVHHQGFLMIVPRSSISKYDIILCNSPAIIDSEYSGEISLRFKLLISREDAKLYVAGDRIGQIIPWIAHGAYFKVVDDLFTTARGSGGWGSTGK